MGTAGEETGTGERSLKEFSIKETSIGTTAEPHTEQKAGQRGRETAAEQGKGKKKGGEKDAASSPLLPSRWVRLDTLASYPFSSPQVLLRDALQAFVTRHQRGDSQQTLFDDEDTV